MKKFFFSHPDIILGGIAFVLLATLIGFFYWGINSIFFEVHRSTETISPVTQGGFDLQDAENINYHGISTSTNAIIPAAPVTTTATNSTSTILPSRTVSSTATTSSNTLPLR